MLYEIITGQPLEFISYDNLEQSMNEAIQSFLQENSNN